MALTVTRTGFNPLGAARPLRGGFGADIVCTMGEFVWDNSYASGGESFPASSMGLEDVLFFIGSCEPSAGATAVQSVSHSVRYDYTNSKILAFGASGTILQMYEVTTGTDLSAFTVRWLAFGHKLV